MAGITDIQYLFICNWEMSLVYVGFFLAERCIHVNYQVWLEIDIWHNYMGIWGSRYSSRMGSQLMARQRKRREILLRIWKKKASFWGREEQSVFSKGIDAKAENFSSSCVFKSKISAMKLKKQNQKIILAFTLDPFSMNLIFWFPAQNWFLQPARKVTMLNAWKVTPHCYSGE